MYSDIRIWIRISSTRKCDVDASPVALEAVCMERLPRRPRRNGRTVAALAGQLARTPLRAPTRSVVVDYRNVGIIAPHAAQALSVAPLGAFGCVLRARTARPDARVSKQAHEVAGADRACCFA